MHRYEIKGSIVQKLCQRELGVKSPYNLNAKLLKFLLVQESQTFQLIWETQSRQPIYYENWKIYKDNYATCFALNGLNLKPKILYKLPPTTSKNKIEDGLLCEVPSTEILLPKKNYRPAFFAITAHGWLYQYDAWTGEKLQEVYLSRIHRFKYLSWNEVAHSFVIKSIINKACPVERQVGYSNCLLSLCLFSVFPVEFLALIEITREVFGKDISDAMIGENLLCVSHQNGFVKIYSVNHILQEGKQTESLLGVYCEILKGVVGSYPKGLPRNVKLKEAPPVLFRVKCEDNDLKVGGFPWHYIITPLKHQNIFEIYSMESQKLASNGILTRKSLCIRPDRALFHPDDSGRVIHITSSELRVYNISADDKSTGLQKSFFIDMQNYQTAKNPPVTHTSSGRLIRWQRTLSEKLTSPFEQALLAFGYENEVDILVILGVDRHSVLEDEVVGYHVNFHDNSNGKFLKRIPLKHNWMEHLENDIFLDLDVLINIRKEFNGKFSCCVYRIGMGKR